MKFNLKRPCANCPFKAKGAIPLRPGRVEGIVKALQNDYTVFPCHKTTHGAAAEESACIGALAYMHREYGGFLPVHARALITCKKLDLDDITANYPILIKPLGVPYVGTSRADAQRQRTRLQQAAAKADIPKAGQPEDGRHPSVPRR